MFHGISGGVLQALEQSPLGIANLDLLASLRFGSRNSLKVTIARLGKAGRLLRLKRGAYSVSPMKDALACAQATFNGYLGFSAALHVHKLIIETPFVITVVTSAYSGSKRFGEYEFRAVALKEKAVGFEKKGAYAVSSRAKTLFDCLYLPQYSVEYSKLIGAYRQAKLSPAEWREFDSYVKRFAKAKAGKRMAQAKKAIRANG